MGYYTSFSMVVRDLNKEDESKLNEALRDKGILNYALDEDPYESETNNELVYSSSDTAKWYEYEEEMMEISSKFPDATFRLHGVGESSEDVWDCYFHNGDSEYCPWIPSPPINIKWKMMS